MLWSGEENGESGILEYIRILKFINTLKTEKAKRKHHYLFIQQIFTEILFCCISGDTSNEKNEKERLSPSHKAYVVVRE